MNPNETSEASTETADPNCRWKLDLYRIIQNSKVALLAEQNFAKFFLSSSSSVILYVLNVRALMLCRLVDTHV